MNTNIEFSKLKVTFNNKIFKLLDTLSIKEKGWIIHTILEWRKNEPIGIEVTSIKQTQPLLYGVWTEIKKILEEQIESNEN